MAKKTRREFVQQTMLGAAALLAYPPARVLGANDRVRIGMIGVGGRGQELLKQVMELPKAQVVAIADVYTRRHDEAREPLPGDKRQLYQPERGGDLVDVQQRLDEPALVERGARLAAHRAERRRRGP